MHVRTPSGTHMQIKSRAQNRRDRRLTVGCSVCVSVCLCSAEFTTYLNYVRSLRFDDKPDYAYLRRIMRELFYRKGYQNDFVFDWTILNYHDASDKNARRSEEEKQKASKPSSSRDLMPGSSSGAQMMPSGLTTPTGMGVAVSSTGVASLDSSMRVAYDPSQSMRSMSGVGVAGNGMLLSGGGGSGGLISSSAMIANSAGAGVMMSGASGSPTAARRAAPLQSPSAQMGMSMSGGGISQQMSLQQQQPVMAAQPGQTRQTSGGASASASSVYSQQQLQQQQLVQQQQLQLQQQQRRSTSSRRSRPEDELRSPTNIGGMAGANGSSSNMDANMAVDFSRLSTDQHRQMQQQQPQQLQQQQMMQQQQVGVSSASSPVYGTRLTKTSVTKQ